MRKIRVCIITNSKKYKGGITAVVSGYSKSKLEEDFDIRYIESCSDSKYALLKIGKMLLGYLQFLFSLIVFRPQIVHINSSFGFSFYRKLYYIYLSKWFGIKIVNHIHGAEFEKFYTNADKKKKQKIQKAYNSCDYLIALSSEWKENLCQIVPEYKVKIIENYSIIHREKPKTVFGSTVLFLGEVGKRKGCLDIPDVIKNVVSVIPKCKFILAGNLIEEDYVKIIEKVNKYGIDKNVVFPGWVRGEEKDKLLSEADIFLLPSYNEGMPMSILDAMGYGLPIVSTTVGGIPKIVRNGENGYITEPGDVSGLSEAIVDLLNNHQKMHEFGEMSIHIVEEKYSLDAHIEKLENLYNALNSGRKLI